MQGQQHALAPAEGRLHGVAEPDTNLLVNDQAIHHGFDGVLLLGVQFDACAVCQLDQFAVHASTDEALPREPFYHVAKLALLVAHNRGEQHDSRPKRQPDDPVHDVAGGLAHNGDAGLGAVRLADVRVEQPQVVINLRRGGDDGTGAGA